MLAYVHPKPMNLSVTPKRRLAERAEGRLSVAHLSTRVSIDQYSQSMNIIRKDELSREQR